jgi:hypothetical protein
MVVLYVKVSVELTNETLKMIEKIAQKGFRNNRNIALQRLIESALQEDVTLDLGNNEKLLLTEVIDLPDINLNNLRTDYNKISNKFENNLFNLPLKYRVPIYHLLLYLTRGHHTDDNKYQCFFGNYENLSMYYSDKHEKNTGYFNFYMNLKGVYGTEKISEKLSGWNRKFRPSNDDPDSPIWISRHERFVMSEKFLNPDKNVQILYDEFLNYLNIDLSCMAVQLSSKELDDLSVHYKKIMDLPEKYFEYIPTYFEDTYKG